MTTTIAHVAALCVMAVSLLHLPAASSAPPYNYNRFVISRGDGPVSWTSAGISTYLQRVVSDDIGKLFAHGVQLAKKDAVGNP